MKAFLGPITSMGGDDELAFDILVQVCRDDGRPIKQVTLSVPYQVTDTTRAALLARAKTAAIQAAADRGVTLTTGDITSILL